MTGKEQVKKILERYRKKEERRPQERVPTSDRDRFFEEWGEIVEQHPISSPKRR